MRADEGYRNQKPVERLDTSSSCLGKNRIMPLSAIGFLGAGKMAQSLSKGFMQSGKLYDCLICISSSSILEISLHFVFLLTWSELVVSAVI